MIPLKRHRLMASRWQCKVIAAALLKLSVMTFLEELNVKTVFLLISDQT